MESPEIRYATSTGGVDIAWQEFGTPDGPRLVWVSGFISHLDLNWDFPPFAAIAATLGAECRVLAFDKRGTGLSGRSLGLGSLAERADDIRAVMDAAGWESAHLFGVSEGGPISIVFAALHPERVHSLSLYGTAARFVAADDYPEGRDLDVARYAEWVERHWGSGKAFAPFFGGDGRAQESTLARFERNASTPKVAGEIMRRNLAIDVRDLLGAVAVPTLVAHASGDPMVPVECARYVAAHVPDARYVEVDLDIHGSWDARDYEQPLNAVLEFVAGTRMRTHSERVLATVLFTDIVASTERASEVGDQRWRALLDAHDSKTAPIVARFGGRVVKQTGDGVLATFDGPARAVQCAQQLGADLARSGIPIRAGLHAGEIVRRDDDVSGIAVHIAARVAALAGAGQVFVSRTVRDLTVGSDLAFEDRGAHELKGVPEPWQIYEAIPA